MQHLSSIRILVNIGSSGKVINMSKLEFTYDFTTKGWLDFKLIPIESWFVDRDGVICYKINSSSFEMYTLVGNNLFLWETI